MGAAFRLTSGYSRMGRGWYYSPNSPFVKKPKCLAVWKVLIDQAGYVGCKGMEPGMVSITIRQLAETALLPRNTTARAIKWLSRFGWIEVISARRGHRIFVPHHEWVYDMDRYLDERARAMLAGPNEKSGTNFLEANYAKPKPNLFVVSEKWDKGFKSGTNLTETVTTLDVQITDEFSQPKIDFEKVGQTSPFLREVSNTNNKYISNAEGSDCSRSRDDNSPPKSNEDDELEDSSEDHKSLRQNNRQDFPTAGLQMIKIGDGDHGDWYYPVTAKSSTNHNHQTKVTRTTKKIPEAKLEIKPWHEEIANAWIEQKSKGTQLKAPHKWVVNIARLEQCDGYTEHEIGLMLKAKQKDPFYSKLDMGLGNIRNAAEPGKPTRAENILNAGRKYEPKSDGYRPILSMRDLMEVCGELK